jgi:hypothetical protein
VTVSGSCHCTSVIPRQSHPGGGRATPSSLATPATLRKAVDELIADRRVTKIGPKEDHHGRGRALTVYELS